MSELELKEWLKSLTETKIDVMTDENQKSYPAIPINRFFSFFPTTIFLVSDMLAKNEFLSNRIQYEKLLVTIAKGKKFKKFLKKDAKHEKLQLIVNYYKTSVKTAKEYLQILTDDDIKKIEQSMSLGGVTKSKKV